MNRLAYPKRLAKRPPRVAASWKDVPALEDLLQSPDVTEEEIRAIFRHPKANLVLWLGMLCPEVPEDVLEWLRDHRGYADPDFPSALTVDELLHLLHITVWTRTRVLLLNRVREKSRHEPLTRKQIGVLLNSPHRLAREEGMRQVAAIR